jgi:cellulose synthase/poly-beta-1,6-N-acetylglucosamine synthase-like glycosyltransferase
MQIDFCLPIKNEGEILEKNSLELLNFLNRANYNFNWNIIILANGTTDNSSEISKKLNEQTQNKIKYLAVTESGRGRALKNYWRQSTADILVFMDIDLAVDLDCLDNLIKPILNKQADLTIGSRFTSTSKVKRSLKRKIISWSYVTLSKIIVPHKSIDLQCGFKAISKEAFMKLEKLFSDDYWFFDTELIILAEKSGLKVSEIAVNWEEKRANSKKSKVKVFKDSCLFIKNLFIFKKRLKKIFFNS